MYVNAGTHVDAKATEAISEQKAAINLLHTGGRKEGRVLKETWILWLINDVHNLCELHFHGTQDSVIDIWHWLKGLIALFFCYR